MDTEGDEEEKKEGLGGKRWMRKKMRKRGGMKGRKKKRKNDE